MNAARLKFAIATLSVLTLFAVSTDAFAQKLIDLSIDRVERTIISRDGGDGLGGPNTMALGDFNDDGRADIVLGAPGGDGPSDRRLDSGEVFIIFGSAGFDPESDIDDFPGPDIIVFGADPGDEYGSGVAAGDVNGDGFDDIIIGAPGGKGFNDSRTDQGEVIVIFGGVNLPTTIDLNEMDPDVTIFGSTQNTDFGGGIVSFDFNADGLDDIIIADRLGGGLSNSRTNSGSAFVVFGQRDMPARFDIDSTNFSEDVAIYGSDRGDQMGTSLDWGDINDDGIADLILGAPLADGPRDARVNGGEVYAIYGRRDFPPEIDISTTTGDVTIFGANAEDQLGYSVGAGDVNGDGIADLVAGAPFADGPEDLRGFSGEVIVVYGRSFVPSVFDVATEVPDVIIYGQNQLENLGTSVEVADLNGDGNFDLTLGATGGKGPEGTRTGAGKVFALGSPGDLPPVIDLSDDDIDLIVFGAATGDNLGSALLAGDISGTGDGFILMGADGADSPADGPDAGAVYVLPAAEFISGGNPPGDDCPPNFPLGDVDGDCRVTIIDAKIICESVLGLRVLTEGQIELADVAPPFGEITLADAIRVAEAAVGLIELEGPETVVDDEEDSSNESSAGASSLQQEVTQFSVNSWRVSSTQSVMEARAMGTAIQAVQLEAFTLQGSQVFDSGWVAGNRALWNLHSSTIRPANGVYLYVLKALGADGQIITSNIRKVVVLR